MGYPWGDGQRPTVVVSTERRRRRDSPLAPNRPLPPPPDPTFSSTNPEFDKDVEAGPSAPPKKKHSGHYGEAAGAGAGAGTVDNAMFGNVDFDGKDDEAVGTFKTELDSFDNVHGQRYGESAQPSVALTAATSASKKESAEQFPPANPLFGAALLDTQEDMQGGTANAIFESGRSDLSAPDGANYQDARETASISQSQVSAAAAGDSAREFPAANPVFASNLLDTQEEEVRGCSRGAGALRWSGRRRPAWPPGWTLARASLSCSEALLPNVLHCPAPKFLNCVPPWPQESANPLFNGGGKAAAGGTAALDSPRGGTYGGTPSAAAAAGPSSNPMFGGAAAEPEDASNPLFQGGKKEENKGFSPAGRKRS